MRRFFPWVLLGVCGLAGPGVHGAEGTPPDAARAAAEEFRSEEERKLSMVTFPTGKSVATLPEGAEVYLIRGYINYDCTRLFRRAGQAHVQRVRTTRSWFYSPKESHGAEEWEVPEADFRRAWEAARLIREATLTVHPQPHSDTVTGARESSSHEPTIFVRVWAGTVLFEDTVRGKSWISGVQKFRAVQTRAITKVFKDLVPKGTAGKAFAMADWGPFLTQLLARTEPELRNAPHSLEPGTMLMGETSLRLLGQMGYRPALAKIRAVEADAQAAPANAAWADTLLRETRYAQAKIALQERFDPAQATTLIEKTDRRLNPDRDFV